MPEKFIDEYRLTSRFWRFRRNDGAIVSDFLSFNEKNLVGGLRGDVYLAWKLFDGGLAFVDRDGRDIVSFDKIIEASPWLKLSGTSALDQRVTFHLEEHEGGRLRINQTKNFFADEIKKYGWSIGDHTYGRPHVVEHGLAQLEIGRYCSIAEGVRISLGNHRSSAISTYPFKALQHYWQFVPSQAVDKSTKGDVRIGHDVWIGEGVYILSGVRVGTGAIIGAGSVVVKDVPPYAIVVGNPGRVVKHRFDQDTIQLLLGSAWWELADEIVDNLISSILTDDARAFVRKVEQARSAWERSEPCDRFRIALNLS